MTEDWDILKSDNAVQCSVYVGERDCSQGEEGLGYYEAFAQVMSDD